MVDKFMETNYVDALWLYDCNTNFIKHLENVMKRVV